jgi:hypothetical protein
MNHSLPCQHFMKVVWRSKAETPERENFLFYFPLSKVAYLSLRLPPPELPELELECELEAAGAELGAGAEWAGAE